MQDETAAEDLAAARRISHVIFEHAARMSRESDISRLLQLNADLARDLTGADRCSLWLLDEAADELWTKVAHGVAEIRVPRKAGVVGACVADDQIVIVNDVALDGRFLGRIDEASAVPLRADGNVIGNLVAEVSQTIYLCSSPERYSTLFCGILDAQRRQLTFVNAGHQAPCLLRENGELERLGPSGPPVGMFPGMAFDQVTVPVNEGDLLLCISDGVSETVNANGDMWDEREVDQVVLETAGASAGEVVERIVQKIRRYSIGAEQFDDMTVAAVRIVTREDR